MIAPMLAGVVYLSALPDFVRLLRDCNIRRVFFHSFWAEVGSCAYVDCHCFAGLTSFANAFKMVVNGQEVEDPRGGDLTKNRNLVGAQLRTLWNPGKGDRIRLIVGQVIDDRPPRSAWVPIDDFLAYRIPADFPVVRYIENRTGEK